MNEILIIPHRIFNEYMSSNKINDKNIDKKLKDKNVYLISIVDSFKDLKPWFKKDHKNVLNLVFDDVNDDKEWKKCKVFNEEIANKIIDFLETTNTNDCQFIIHCAAGVSRSGAVGEFVSDFIKMKYSDFKRKNPHICPNKTVSRILRKVYRERLNKNYTNQ